MKKFKYDDSTVVSTKAGKLQGYFFDGSYVFKGVHYAEAERFQAPTPVEPWEGVKDATSYGMVCPLMHQDRPMGEIMVPHAYWPQDEHCQNLNIWTTALCTKKKMPVMVWLHGGGFSAGSSIEQLCYDGAAMAKEGDVVVVTVNHRLNLLGYLDLSPFGEKYKNSGNAGNADLVAALKWVKENIAAFGGDPDNVTIFGQSGGGMKVTSLMQTPAADGLFHKAIVMSGVLAKGFMGVSEGGGRPLVEAMLKELKLSEAEVEKLETLPYDQLVAAYEKVLPDIAKQGLYRAQAPLENDWYLGEPQFVGFTENSKKIPLMVGTVFGEFAFMPLPFNKDEMTEDEMYKTVKERFGEHTDELIAEFKKAYPDKKIVDLISYDSIFRIPSCELVEAAAKRKEAPTYSYLFSLEFPIQHNKPAWHCSDIAFFFHNIDMVPVANVPGVSDKLQEQIFRAVMAFAKTGDPNHAELPHWDASTEGDEAVMVFDRTCECRHNFDHELLKIHEKALPPFNFGAVENAQH